MKLPTLSNNLDLPPLPGLYARSTWAMLLMVASSVLMIFGIDLYAVFAEMGLGTTPEEVLANGERARIALEPLLALLGGVWVYLERRAPRYRLVWWRVVAAEQPTNPVT